MKKIVSYLVLFSFLIGYFSPIFADIAHAEVPNPQFEEKTATWSSTNATIGDGTSTHIAGNVVHSIYFTEDGKRKLAKITYTNYGTGGTRWRNMTVENDNADNGSWDVDLLYITGYTVTSEGKTIDLSESIKELKVNGAPAGSGKYPLVLITRPTTRNDTSKPAGEYGFYPQIPDGTVIDALAWKECQKDNSGDFTLFMACAKDANGKLMNWDFYYENPYNEKEKIGLHWAATNDTNWIFGWYLKQTIEYLKSGTKPKLIQGNMPKEAVDQCRNLIVKPESQTGWKNLDAIKSVAEEFASEIAKINGTEVKQKFDGSKYKNADIDMAMYTSFYANSGSEYPDIHSVNGAYLDKQYDLAIKGIKMFTSEEARSKYSDWWKAMPWNKGKEYPEGQFDMDFTSAAEVIVGAGEVGAAFVGYNKLKSLQDARAAASVAEVTTTGAAVTEKAIAQIERTHPGTNILMPSSKGANVALTAPKPGAELIVPASRPAAKIKAAGNKFWSKSPGKANIYALIGIITIGIALWGIKAYAQNTQEDYLTAVFQSELGLFYLQKNIEFHECIMGSENITDETKKAFGFTQEILDDKNAVAQRFADQTLANEWNAAAIQEGAKGDCISPNASMLSPLEYISFSICIVLRLIYNTILEPLANLGLGLLRDAIGYGGKCT
ncbi:MAG: hypothetical protein WC107_00155 [Patescibacteria group bacterium]